MLIIYFVTEIEELEELIRLQRLKCDLLHRKNTAVTAKSDTVASSLKASETSDDKHDGATINVLHERKDSKDIAVRIADNVRNVLMSTTNFKDERDTEVAVKDDKSESKIEAKLIQSEPVKETKEDRFVNAITRLSRLNTDLANERNLLAWARTALASARTFLAFVGVSAVTNFGKASRQICYLGFAIMSIYIILQGTERYNKIKRIVYLKNPPPNFDRLTNAPLPICLALLFCLGLMSISFDQWED